MVLDSSKLPGQLKRAETNNGSGTVLDARSSMSLMLENFGRPGENTSPQKRLGHFPQRKSSQWTCDDEKHLTPSNPSKKKNENLNLSVRTAELGRYHFLKSSCVVQIREESAASRPVLTRRIKLVLILHSPSVRAPLLPFSCVILRNQKHRFPEPAGRRKTT